MKGRVFKGLAINPPLVTMTNTGTTTLNITGVVSSGDFSTTNTCGTSLAAGKSCSIVNRFAPTAPGTRTGTVTITDSDPSSPQIINLTGTGTAVNLSATNLIFASQGVNTASAAKTITLTNAGSTALSIEAHDLLITPIGDFSQSTTCPSSLPGGSNCAISVTFKPAATGSRYAQLLINDSDPTPPSPSTFRA